MIEVNPYHVTVLLHETVQHLVTNPNGVYIDATFGGGGHSQLLLSALAPDAKVLAFDQDSDVAGHLPQDSRFQWIQANFRHLQKFLRLHGITKVDGIMADLGVSSHQFDEADRGFSYRFDASLDMRMDTSKGITAADILNSYSEEQLLNVFAHYGEVRNSKSLAKAVVETRIQHPYVSIADLNQTAQQMMIGDKFKYLSQLYQALRIEVNDEIGALKDLLLQSKEVLTPGGRLAVITFHSLEDRPVKNFMKHGTFQDEPEKDFFGNFQTPFRLVTKKPVLPTADEIKNNSRSRSAKLRVAEKK